LKLAEPDLGENWCT